MPSRKQLNSLTCLVLFFLVTLITACRGTPPLPTATMFKETPVLLTATPFQPAQATPTLQVSNTPSPTNTPTPEPLAVLVNGEGITLKEYQAELGRYQAAQKELGKSLPSDADQRKIVLDNLIDEVLLAQGAVQSGYKSGPDDLKTRLDELSNRLGGAEALAKWEQQNGYDDASFRRALARSIAAAWERDQIAAQVPQTADQVHVRQILVYNKQEADANLAKLKSGVDFATIALAYDRDTGGDLGWFPQGYLLAPEVESVAFTLKTGEYSEVIQSKVGFHIIQVLERDPQHTTID